MINVYRIKFSKSSFDLNDDYDRLSDYEKERIVELDAHGFFDYNDDDSHYIVYVIASPLEIKQYIGILENNLVKIKVTDISNDVLTNKIDLSEDLKSQINTSNSIKYSFFIDDLEDWVYNNLDMDTILDRISEIGMGSLREVEKDYLKDYNQ